MKWENSLIIILYVVWLSSCSPDKVRVSKNWETSDLSKDVIDSSIIINDLPHYAEETTGLANSEKIKLFLNDYLIDELNLLGPEDREFSFYEVDLNGDEKNEYFVKLYGSYFCGSGGCTFLLLSNDLKIINRFSVMRGPVFQSSETTNGWNDLILIGDLIKDKEKYVHLKWDSVLKRYPSNPSMLSKSGVAPSGHDFIMWDEEFSNPKIFIF